MACPACARLRRWQHAAINLSFLSAYPVGDLRFTTLINPVDEIQAGHLHGFDPKKMIARTRRQFERLGINRNGSFLIGYVDGEWDAGWGVYRPHLHAISWNIDSADLVKLIGKWPKVPSVRARKRREAIDDLPRVAAYLDKSFWPAVARKRNLNGIHPHRKRRPPPDVEREILLWLDRQSTGELRLLLGVKTYGRLMMKT